MVLAWEKTLNDDSVKCQAGTKVLSARAAQSAAAAVGSVSLSAKRKGVPEHIPLERSVKLTPADWARVPWRSVTPLRASPRPFDLDACLNRATSMFTRYSYSTKIAAAIPASLSKDEAWFWLQCFDALPSSHYPGSYHIEPDRLAEALRTASAQALPDDADVRAWTQDTAQRRELSYYDAPQTLRPFFTPVEIAELIVRKYESDVTTKRVMSWYGTWASGGFLTYILPYLSEPERTGFRSTLERLYDTEGDPLTPRAQLTLAFLSMVGGGHRLAAFIARQPDKAWADDWWPRNLHSSGYFQMLAGLGDEVSFVREAKRMGCSLRLPGDFRLWLAATEWRALEAVRDAVLAATAKDEAVARARMLALVEAPEAALPMLQIQLESKAPGIAAEWLEAHPLHAAVGLAPVAMGQGKLADAAREHLRSMRRAGRAPILSAAQAHLTSEQGAWLQREILDGAQELSVPEISGKELPDALRAAFAQFRAAKPPASVSRAALPPIRLQGGRLAAQELATLLAALQSKAATARAALIGLLKQHADTGSLDAFAWGLFEQWQSRGAPSKDKWVMGAIGHLGGDGCVLKLTPLVREWPGQSQHARAMLGLECLRDIGSETALMALNGIAEKLKFKRLKARAQEMMSEIAKARGLTQEQLADRIVPDCGLDSRGSRVFDFGPRQFRFVLGPQMKPLVRDVAGKVRPDLPGRAKSDDAAKADAAIAEWKLLKKTLREVLKVQSERLEEAMITGRRWQRADFETLLVKHPLMVNLVRQLVLAAYDEAGKVTRTFRVTEDQTFADQNDQEIVLPSGQIGVVHPAHLSDALKSAWGQVLGDYEIIPPFPQLGREISRPLPEERQSTQITRYQGSKIPGIVLYGMLERSHWQRDTPADGGGFHQHSKHFPSANVTAFIKYTGLAMGYLEEPQELEAVYFVPGHVPPSWWGDHKNRLRIKEVDTVVLSEVLRLAGAIASKGT